MPRLGWGSYGTPGARARTEFRTACLLQEFIKAEPPDSLRTPIRKKALLACTHLVYPVLWAWGFAGAHMGRGLANMGCLSGCEVCGVGDTPPSLTQCSVPWSQLWKKRC